MSTISKFFSYLMVSLIMFVSMFVCVFLCVVKVALTIVLYPFAMIIGSVLHLVKR